jgi:acyl-CoA synthetase (AMP-forming)/AMP-acid ligase II
VRRGKGKGGDVRSELDRRYDAKLAELTAPGGPLVVDRDAQGRAFLKNFPATLPALFRTFCELYASNEAIVDANERLTFADLDRISERVARGLAARGIVSGDRVGIAMRNCPSWVIAYMGIAKAGGIATLLNGWWQALEMEQALTMTEPTLIIADRPRAERIAAKCDRFDIVSLAVDEPIETALAPLLDQDGRGLELPEVGPEDDATILFTSGSTGNAKGALSTHRAVTTGAYSYATGLMVLKELLTEDNGVPPPTPRTLINVPLFHVTGEVPVMLNSFVVGRCMVMMAKWDATEALRLIEKERITYFVGVPTMSLELMTHPDLGKFDLSSLRDITAGGAPRPVSHVERLKRAIPNAQPALGYGLTETNAVGCINFWTNYAAKPGSTGRAAAYVDVAILDEAGRQLPAGEKGEIAIRTAAAIKGYWRAPQETEALFTSAGWVHTGDIGYLDEDSYLFIVDRKKDIIIRGGENISAAEVEAACYACSDVREVSVFAAADERLGEVPIAVVHGRDGVTEEVLRAFLEQRLAKFKIPARFIFSQEPLPRLGTGKIDRQALKAQYGS